MKITKHDIAKLKSFADEVDPMLTNIAKDRAAAYLAIESMEQIRNNTRNNIIFIILGGLIGFFPAFYQSRYESKKVMDRVENVRKEMLDIKNQINGYQTHQFKKDTLKSF